MIEELEKRIEELESELERYKKKTKHYIKMIKMAQTSKDELIKPILEALRKQGVIE